MSQLPERYHFITPVWGAKYIDRFVDVSLPTLLAAGNLPALPAERCLFQIFTRPAEEPRLRQSRSFRRLTALVPVRVDFIDERLVGSDALNSNPYAAMTDCHNRALGLSRGVDAAFAFAPPDLLWGEGALAQSVELLGAGKRAILVLPVRMSADHTTIADLQQFQPGAGDGAISVPRRELVALVLRHLHPFSVAQLCNAWGNRAVGHYFWPVGSHGLVARCLHLHPVLVRPRGVTGEITTNFDHDFVRLCCQGPGDMHVVVDSDEICVSELTDPVHHCLHWISPQICETAQLVDFMSQWTNALHRETFRKPILLHARDLTAEWEPAIRASEEFVQSAFEAFHRRHAHLPDAGETLVGSSMAPPTNTAAAAASNVARLAELPRTIKSRLRSAAAAIYRRINAKLYEHVSALLRQGLETRAFVLETRHEAQRTQSATIEALAALLTETRREVEALKAEVAELRGPAPAGSAPGPASGPAAPLRIAS